MKKYILALLPFLFFFPAKATAQYDFPTVINGLSIGLDLTGAKWVNAQQFLSLPPGDCIDGYEIKLHPFTLQFPRGSEPPAAASDSLLFTCDDFQTEGVEVWYRNLHGKWSVADSYVVIRSLDDCEPCEMENCEGISPILYNGLSISYLRTNPLAEIRAKELVATPIEPGVTHSFSPDPADSIRTFSCPENFTEAVTVYSHKAGFVSQFSSTYVATNSNVDCDFSGGDGASARVIQGLSIPNTSAEIITVPAKAFLPLHGPPQQLSFSLDPTDTLFTLTCDQIGMGGINLEIYNHISGEPGTPAITYLTGDDTQNHCNDDENNRAPNDSLSNALLIDSCVIFQQFTNASIEAGEDQEPGAGGSVWYEIPLPAPEDGPNDFPRVNIKAIDSVYASLYIGQDINSLIFLDGNIVYEDIWLEPACVTRNRAGRQDERVFVKISQLEPGLPARYYLSYGLIRCFTAVEEISFATLESYPNPTREKFFLALPENFGPRGELSVFGARGRRVAQQTVLAGQNQIEVDIARENSGIFFLQLTNGRVRWTGKVVKN